MTDFVRNFADLINRVAYRGENLRLRRGGRVLAEVRAVPEAHRVSELPELLRALPRLGADDATVFAADLDRARRELDRLPPEDRWAS